MQLSPYSVHPITLLDRVFTLFRTMGLRFFFTSYPVISEYLLKSLNSCPLVFFVFFLLFCFFQKKYRHLTVVDVDNRPIGMITRKDLVYLEESSAHLHRVCGKEREKTERK